MTEWRTGRPMLGDSGRTVAADVTLPGGARPTIIGKLSMRATSGADAPLAMAWVVVGETGGVYPLEPGHRWRFTEPSTEKEKDAVELQWEQYCDLWDQFGKNERVCTQLGKNERVCTRLSFWREMSEAGRASRISKLKEQLSVEDSFSTKYASTHGEIW